MGKFKKWLVFQPDHIGCTNVKFGEELWDGFIEIWHHQTSKEQAKANAILISKAPEMLEMLEIILDELQDYSDTSIGTEMIPKIQKLIKEATTI